MAGSGPADGSSNLPRATICIILCEEYSQFLGRLWKIVTERVKEVIKTRGAKVYLEIL